MTIRTCGAAILAGALAFAGCQGEDGAGEPAPLLTITNSWADETDSAHTFDLVADDEDGRAAGTFTGVETLPDFTQFSLAGSWADGAVRFTVFRLVEVVYEAEYAADNPTRLVFSSAEGDLVLVRDAGRIRAGDPAP
ncbi:MAG TPA: hypothetical protein PLL30_03655 [Candidatus Krumholzibacteria bacterium]|nr:hypothetical protein [Candidatus Krumholzibacteria bacterium]HPD70869.1 hypothetical protein [Candidatus Krumholzibacteria bacterium]HRY39431.1 hypothetical protein [Candidatus Krumholzibacteria bacterium]